MSRSLSQRGTSAASDPRELKAGTPPLVCGVALHAVVVVVVVFASEAVIVGVAAVGGIARAIVLIFVLNHPEHP